MARNNVFQVVDGGRKILVHRTEIYRCPCGRRLIPGNEKFTCACGRQVGKVVVPNNKFLKRTLSIAGAAFWAAAAITFACQGYDGLAVGSALGVNISALAYAL